jgi:chaperonin GroEL
MATHPHSTGVPSRPGVVNGESLDRLGIGIHKLAALIRPTYGPVSRVVINAGPNASSRPEVLDYGGDIARRVVQLPHPVEDAGAMLLRGLLCELDDRLGDGVALAAIIFDTVFQEGIRAIAAGANGPRLRHHLLRKVPIVVGLLERQSIPLDDECALHRVVRSACGGDEAIGELLFALHRRLGPFGNLEVRAAKSRVSSTSTLGGPYWETDLHDSTMVLGYSGQRAEFRQCAVFVSDLDLDDAAGVASIISAAKDMAVRSLLIICRSLSQTALATIMVNRSDAFAIHAVRPPTSDSPGSHQDLADIALVLGARLYLRAQGDAVTSIAAEHFGLARTAWASRTHVGFVSPQGNPKNIRQLLHHLRSQSQIAPEQRNRLHQRIGRLSGRSMVLHVGGISPQDVESRHSRAKRASQVVRQAMHGGVLPGGGMALLRCAGGLDEQPSGMEMESLHAVRILAAALEAPARQLALNQGVDWTSIMASPTPGDPGVCDPAGTVITSVRMAIEHAAQALSIQSLVLRREPHMAIKP